MLLCGNQATDSRVCHTTLTQFCDLRVMMSGFLSTDGDPPANETSVAACGLILAVPGGPVSSYPVPEVSTLYDQ